MKNILLLAVAGLVAASAQATLTDSFTDDDRGRKFVTESIPAGNSMFTLTGESTGVQYKFVKVGSTAEPYCYKMDASICPAIFNVTRPADSTLVVNEISLDNFVSGTLRVYGVSNSQSKSYCYTAYARVPQGDKLGELTPDNPTLKVYGAYAAVIIEPDLEATASCIFQTVNFTWGAEQTAPDAPEEPAASTWEISDLQVVSGPYPNTNRDAYLTFDFKLTYNGEGAASIRISPDVVQGVVHHDFLSMKVDFDGPETKELRYSNTLTGTIPCDINVDATLKVQGDGKMLYSGPITVCNYSPSLSVSTEMAGATDVAYTGLEIAATFGCSKGPYHGILECLIYPSSDCASGTSIAKCEIIEGLAVGESKTLTFSFPELTLEPNTTYGFSFWRSKANPNNTGKVGQNMQFTTGNLSGIQGVESGEEAIDADAPTYNLLGQPVDAARAPRGLYIRGGRKVVIR